MTVTKKPFLIVSKVTATMILHVYYYDDDVFVFPRVKPWS